MSDVTNKNLWWGLLRKGTFKDMKGKEQVFDDARLDKVIEATNKYEYQNNEIPIVVGHPKADSPKWGSVLKTNIKRMGDNIVGQPNKLVTEFQEWVEKGLYDNISIALRPDNSIKHIGFLGAQPPAITGLPAVCFAEEDNDTVFEFAESMQSYELSKWYFQDLATVLRGVKNYFVEKLGAEAADKMMPEGIMTNLNDPPPVYPVYEPMTNQFSENNKDTIMTTEEIAAKDKKIKDLETENLALKDKEKTEAAKTRHNGFIAFCESEDMKKKISPVLLPRVIALMEAFEDSEEICFAEEGVEKKSSAVDELKNLLKLLPEVVEFGEHATKDRVEISTGVTAEIKTGNDIADLVNKKK
jgi:cell fate (sporulation/competence/biofilm development) regulator YmcA (YheA/YmcA/DUF963 family)